MSEGRLHRRQGHEVHAHLFGQRQFFGVMAGRRQPARRRQRTTGRCVFAQLCRGNVPTGGREISQPFERPLDHQLRLAGAQSHRVHSQITILGVVTVRCAQLDQLDAARDGFLDPPQQGRGFQILRGDQVLLGQTGSGDDRSIGLRKLVIRELTGGHPGQRLTFGTMRFAGERRDFPNIQ